MHIVSEKKVQLNLKLYICVSFGCLPQVPSRRNLHRLSQGFRPFFSMSYLILIIKAYQLGIHSNLLRWLVSYLFNRSQLVVLTGYNSDPFIPESRVSQGFNLGPLLFFIFINDLLLYRRHKDL